MGLMITDAESTSSSSPIADLESNGASDPMEMPDRSTSDRVECLPFRPPSFAASSSLRPSHRHVSLSLACARSPCPPTRIQISPPSPPLRPPTCTSFPH